MPGRQLKKNKVTLELNYDFLLLGIASPAKDYRISSLLNKALKLELVRDNDHTMEVLSGLAEYKRYHYNDELTKTTYRLIANKSDKGNLVPEKGQVDYFLIVNGNNADKEWLLEKIKGLDIVQTAFEIDAEQLKSRQNLILE